MRISVHAIIALFCASALAACSARVDSFQQFARAAIAYSQVADRALQQAGEVKVDASSSVLVAVRQTWAEPGKSWSGDPDVGKREKAILEKNEVDRQYLTVVYDLRAHARLLRNYFVALEQLAADDPSNVVRSTESIVRSISVYGARLAAARIDGRAVADSVGPIGPLAFARLRRKKLEKELRAAGPTLHREFDRHVAVLQSLADSAGSHLADTSSIRTMEQVVQPYVSNASQLPKKWMQTRRQVLIAQVSLDSAQHLADAAKSMRGGFVALAENRLTIERAARLLDDIERARSTVDTLETARR